MKWLLHRTPRLALLALLVVPLAGCGGDADKRDKMVVKGVVSVDGKPTGGVILAFYPTGEKAAVGSVTTQVDGSYEVMFKTHAGEGNYKVTATKVQAKAGSAGKEIAKGEGIDDFQLSLAAGSSGPIHLLDEKYSSLERTDLTAVLQKGQNDGKNFAVKAGTGQPTRR